jgi:small GTP-binding protein
MAERAGPNQARLLIKIVVVGASSVGKSSIVQRLVHDRFLESGTTTCGADFYTYQCPVDNQMVRLQIWDTAGQERFRSISRSYFRNAAGAVLVYDITSLSSFDELADWLNDIQKLCLPNAYVLLVANKIDREEERQVSQQQVDDFCKEHKIAVVETSARNGKGVKEAFHRLALDVFVRVKAKQIAPIKAVSLPVDTAEPPANKNTQCC